MKKTITKRQVINALEEQPLATGSYFYSDGSKKCRVCAVAAILIKMGFEKEARKRDLLDIIGSIATQDMCVPFTELKIMDALEEKNYLGALSGHFEQNGTRKSAIEFVKKNFPEKLTLKIDFNKGVV